MNFYHGSGETNTTHYGEEIEDNRLARIWDELLDSSELRYAEEARSPRGTRTHPYRKRGMAITPVKFGISFTLKHYNQAGALVLIYADGSVQVNHGGTEMGQGLHTKILGVAMRELGLSAGSHPLDAHAHRQGPQHLRHRREFRLGSQWHGRGRCLPATARTSRCRLPPKNSAARRTRSFSPIRMSAHPIGKTTAIQGTRGALPMSTACIFRPRAFTRLRICNGIGQSAKASPSITIAFGAAVSEVEVDGFTGTHHIRRVDILHDVGDSLNPPIDRGQIEGGFVQGAGWLTTEELKWNDDGKLLTHSASTYAIPAFSDAPLDFRVTPSDRRRPAKHDPRQQSRRRTAADARDLGARSDPRCG